jgi:hypothetical protein
LASAKLSFPTLISYLEAGVTGLWYSCFIY